MIEIDWTSYVMGFVSCFIVVAILHIMPAFLDTDDM